MWRSGSSGSSVSRSLLPPPVLRCRRKGSFMRQRVNTGWMGLRHCSFSRWAITPTTLVPKTRLSGVSVRPFTPPNPTLALCECALWSGSTAVCAFGGVRGVTEGLFVTDRVGRGPELRACMQKLQRYNRPPHSGVTGGHSSHARRAEGRTSVIDAQWEESEGGWGGAGLMTFSFARTRRGALLENWLEDLDFDRVKLIRPKSCSVYHLKSDF